MVVLQFRIYTFSNSCTAFSGTTCVRAKNKIFSINKSHHVNKKSKDYFRIKLKINTSSKFFLEGWGEAAHFISSYSILAKAGLEKENFAFVTRIQVTVCPYSLMVKT